ncbi:hypothetical protein [Tsukamurella tyrosinosolvens]|uniref:hypothetical protein n=1 Tax=Tsukamurella tyrosinosolvens TaxID=57704 RepID=UPI00125F86CE|nr:hypothetical protein [Tsukamurella tyrosinosolvens]
MTDISATASKPPAPFAVVAAAALIGIAAGIVGPVMLADPVRAWFDLPQPNPVPHQYRADKSFSPTYWLPWAVVWPTTVAPGVVMMAVRRTRSAGLAYAVATGLVAGAVVAFFRLFDWAGFAPD